jgi:hypothetical protein
MISEERRAYNRAYYAAHHKKLTAYRAAYAADHCEEIAAYQADYRATNHAHLALQKHAYYMATRQKNAKRKRLADAKYRAKHRAEAAAYKAIYDVTHKKERSASALAYKIALRNTVFNHYGGKCVRCGVDDLNKLNLHHINFDGGKHRKEIGSGRSALCRWIKKNNYPDSFQVLCVSCHRAIHLEHRVACVRRNNGKRK